MSYFQDKQGLLEMLERESDPFLIEDVSKMVCCALAVDNSFPLQLLQYHQVMEDEEEIEMQIIWEERTIYISIVTSLS